MATSIDHFEYFMFDFQPGPAGQKSFFESGMKTV